MKVSASSSVRTGLSAVVVNEVVTAVRPCAGNLDCANPRYDDSSALANCRLNCDVAVDWCGAGAALTADGTAGLRLLIWYGSPVIRTARITAFASSIVKAG